MKLWDLDNSMKTKSIHFVTKNLKRCDLINNSNSLGQVDTFSSFIFWFVWPPLTFQLPCGFIKGQFHQTIRSILYSTLNMIFHPDYVIQIVLSHPWLIWWPTTLWCMICTIVACAFYRTIKGGRVVVPC